MHVVTWSTGEQSGVEEIMEELTGALEHWQGLAVASTGDDEVVAFYKGKAADVQAALSRLSEVK